MTITRRFIAGTALIAALLFLALDAVYGRFLPGPHRAGLGFGLAVSLVNITGSYFLLSWGGRRGDRTFFSSFAGGMLGRFAIVGLAAWAAYRIPALDFQATLITLVAAFFPLAGFEVYCLVRRLEGEGRARAGDGGARPDGGRSTGGRPVGAAKIAPLALLAAIALAGSGPAGATGDAPTERGISARAAGEHAEARESAAAEEHAEAREHAAPAERAPAAGHGDDVFGHLFHHLRDEVVLPLPHVRVGGLDVDLSITKLVVMLWVVVALNAVLFGVLARKSRSIVPRGRYHNLLESLVLFVKRDMVEEIMGHHLAHKFTPYFLTVFFFILFANLLGLVPFMHTATGNIAVTAAMASTTLFMMQFAGIREQGLVGYVRSIVPPGIPAWLLPIMIPVEVLGQLTKPFALTIRLFANMTAGHVVILTLFGLLFVFKSIVLAPAILGFVLFVSALELLVAFLQAYIFTFLSILFVTACAHPEH